LLRISAAHSTRAFNRALSKLSLDVRSYHVLYLASLTDLPFNQGSVASMLEVNQNRVSEIVKELSDRKLIRQLPNHANRREKFLALTQQGRECLDKATELSEQVRDRLLSRLSPEERILFVCLLAKFASDWLIGPT
jgi:DNA-binding MarR family transcriptional regulator